MDWETVYCPDVEDYIYVEVVNGSLGLCHCGCRHESVFDF